MRNLSTDKYILLACQVCNVETLGGAYEWVETWPALERQPRRLALEREHSSSCVYKGSQWAHNREGH